MALLARLQLTLALSGLKVDANATMQGPSKIAAIPSFTVPDAYATAIAGPIAISQFGILRIKVREIGGSNGLKVKVLAGPGSAAADLDTITINGLTETPVTASGSMSVTINGPHMYVDVQVKNTVGGSAATVKVDITVGLSNTNLQLPPALASDNSMAISDTGLNWKPSVIASGTDKAGTVYTTTAAYLSCIGGPVLIGRPYASIAIHVKEANVNAIMYQIVGYLEGSGFSRPIILATALPVAKNVDDYQIVTMGLVAIDVQAVDAVGGTHGSVIADVACI